MKFVYNDGGRANAGFKGNAGDCATRAIAIVTGIPYLEVYNMINEAAKSERTGKRKRGISNARTGVYTGNVKGTAMYLDPCGKYHHVLSPNGITKKCTQFWESLYGIANDLNMWIEPGEGDLCDVFICKRIE